LAATRRGHLRARRAERAARLRHLDRAPAADRDDRVGAAAPRARADGAALDLVRAWRLRRAPGRLIARRRASTEGVLVTESARSKPSHSLTEEALLRGGDDLLVDFDRAYRMFQEFVGGCRALFDIGPTVTVFGSARFPETHRYYRMAR